MRFASYSIGAESLQGQIIHRHAPDSYIKDIVR